MSKTITGNGIFIVGDQEYGPASYSLDVDIRPNGAADAKGIITASLEGLNACFNPGRPAFVETTFGEKIELIITDWDSVSTTARVVPAGRIPGI